MISRQKYNLGELVYVFRQTGVDTLEEGFGQVRRAEINRGGVIQYTVLVVNRETKAQQEWQANTASIGNSELEMKQKKEKYINFLREQKVEYERNFGKPEFAQKELYDGE